jgi:hypothetical protein
MWDVYGCCKNCEKYERMDRQSKEYWKWVKTKAFTKWKKDHEEDSVVCHPVMKLDCSERTWNCSEGSWKRKQNGNWKMANHWVGKVTDCLIKKYW